MNRLLKSEMSKLTRARPLHLIALLMLVLSVVTSLSCLSYVNSPKAEELEIVFYGYDAFFSSLKDTPTISVLAALAISIVVCGDFENRTTQLKIVVGYHRAPIFFSKLIAAAAADVILLLPYVLGRTVLQSVLLGFGHPFTLEAAANMAAAFFAAVLTGIAINGITFILAFLLRKTVLVVAAGFCLVLLGGNALVSFGVSTPWFGRLLANTPLGLLRAMDAAAYAPAMVGKAFGISMVWIAAFALLTCRIFQKAELK